MSDYIIINDDLRTMQIPQSITLLGVESDDDVNKILFKMPKEYSGFDLSTFQARINYMNANGDGDIYIVEDLAIDDDPTMMTFTWLVGRNACKYKGHTRFIVCLKLFETGTDEVVKEFNTTVYSLPVLEGLETTEAVEQQNADIIEYLKNLIENAGIVDFSNYYTKAQVNALIPTKLPNPEKLVINGQEYDGSAEVTLTIDGTSEQEKSILVGTLVHVTDAVPKAVVSLDLYDVHGGDVASASISVTNKNLFRIDQLANQVITNGITFVKNSDGTVTASGTSTDVDAMTSCYLDKYIFEIGKTFTLNSGKTLGSVAVDIELIYSDATIEHITSQNAPQTFTIRKAVEGCIASVLIADAGVTVSNEVVYPQLEVGNIASAFVNNIYSTMIFDGSEMPVLPDAISNLWANSTAVASIEITYDADYIIGKIDEYITENLIGSGSSSGTLVASYDGVGTVTLGLG